MLLDEKLVIVLGNTIVVNLLQLLNAALYTPVIVYPFASEGIVNVPSVVTSMAFGLTHAVIED